MHRPELAWLFANHDFKTFFSGHISPEFSRYQDFRHYVYEHAPGVPQHGCVRVTYKKDLLAHPAGSPLPEFQPYILDDEGRAITDPAGVIFMNEPFPRLDLEPPREVWVPNETTDAEGVAAAAQPPEGGADAGQAAGGRAKGAKAWGRAKVMKDAQSRAAGFPAEKREQ